MTQHAKKRHPVVAALLSAVLMGLGQLYNGQLKRAAVFFALYVAAFGVAATVSMFLFSFHGVIGLYLAAAIFAGLYIYAIADAFIGARYVGKLELTRFNRWYVYVSVYLAMTLIQVVFEPPVASYSIPAGSMKPTLLIGDYVFADKNAYRERDPNRGDVVIFKLPSDNQTDYVKRLIGLPGDRVQMIDGVLHINDKPIKRERIDDFANEHPDGSVQHIKMHRETLPNGVFYRTLDLFDRGPGDNTGKFVVPDDHYFMMGDHRDNSTDSRFMSHVGFVPAVNLVSRAEVLYFSQNGTADWWQVMRWPGAIRFDRIGKTLY